MKEHEQNTDTSAQVQALVGLAKYKPGDSVWVSFDPKWSNCDDVPVFQCDVDSVGISVEFTPYGNIDTTIKHEISIAYTLDNSISCTEDELFTTKAEAMRYGAALMEKRASAAEHKAREYRTAADAMNAA